MNFCEHSKKSIIRLSNVSAHAENTMLVTGGTETHFRNNFASKLIYCNMKKVNTINLKKVFNEPLLKPGKDRLYVVSIWIYWKMAIYSSSSF